MILDQICLDISKRIKRPVQVRLLSIDGLNMDQKLLRRKRSSVLNSLKYGCIVLKTDEGQICFSFPDIPNQISTAICYQYSLMALNTGAPVAYSASRLIFGIIFDVFSPRQEDCTWFQQPFENSQASNKTVVKCSSRPQQQDTNRDAICSRRNWSCWWQLH